MLTALLEEEGLIVEVADHGGEAVGTVYQAKGNFDCVLMDLQMPEMDGIEAANELFKASYDLDIAILRYEKRTGLCY